MMGALSVDGSGLPGRIYLGHLLPENPTEKKWELLSPHRPWGLDMDFLDFIQSLEDEFERTQRAKASEGGKEKALLITIADSDQGDIEESVHELEELVKGFNRKFNSSLIYRNPKMFIKKYIGTFARKPSLDLMKKLFNRQ